MVTLFGCGGLPISNALPFIVIISIIINKQLYSPGKNKPDFEDVSNRMSKDFDAESDALPRPSEGHNP